MSLKGTTTALTSALACWVRRQSSTNQPWGRLESSALMRTPRFRPVVSWFLCRRRSCSLRPPSHLQGDRKRLPEARHVRTRRRSPRWLDSSLRVRHYSTINVKKFVTALHRNCSHIVKERRHIVAVAARPLYHSVFRTSSLTALCFTAKTDLTSLLLLLSESRFHSVKQALHTAVPERLLSREAERASIRSFLEEKVLQHHPSSLYISGAPGTGKTACLNCVLQEMKVLQRGGGPLLEETPLTGFSSDD